MKREERKSRVIAVSGKGGVGKTLVASLIIRLLHEKGVKNILAIDADPDSNLAGSLGVKFEKTLGDIREDFLNNKPSPGTEKKGYLEAKVFEITVETEDFDLLVMGRPEGSGCYCAINHMLREIVDSTTEVYDYVVIDAEAGLEHLSRRTTENVDIMLIVTDTSQKSIKTATRIKGLTEELDIKFEDMFVILNRVKEGNTEAVKMIKDKLNSSGLKVIGEIPEDPLVTEYDLGGKPLAELPDTSKAYNSMSEIIDVIE